MRDVLDSLADLGLVDLGALLGIGGFVASVLVLAFVMIGV